MKAPINNSSTSQSLYLFSFTHFFVDLFIPPLPFLIHFFFFLFLMSQYKILFHQRTFFLTSHLFKSFISSIFQSLYIFNSAKVSIMRINESGSMKIEMNYNIFPRLESLWLIKKYYLLSSSASRQFFDG